MIDKFLQTVKYSSSGKISKKDVNRFLVFLCLSPYCKRITKDYAIFNLPDLYRKTLFKDLNFSWYYKAIKIDNSIYEIKLPKLVKHMIFNKSEKLVIQRKSFTYMKSELIDELFLSWNITSLRRIEKISRFSNTSKKNMKLLGFQFIPLHEAYCKECWYNRFQEKLIFKFNKYILYHAYVIDKMLKRKLKHRYNDVYWKINIRDEVHLYNSDKEIFKMIAYPYENFELKEVEC